MTTNPQAETVHGCPPDGSGLTPCCGRTPFELPRTDRISSEAPITCQGAVSVPASAPTDRTALRDRIAKALHAQMPGCTHDEHGGDCEALADAILAVLPAPADRATILRAEAEHLIRDLYPAVYEDAGYKTALGVNRAARELLDRADEAALHAELAAAVSGSGRVADETQTRSDIGTEFVRQADHPDTAALDAADAEVRTLAQLADADPEYRALLRSRFTTRPGTATVASDMCPRCKGDNAEPWALCSRCADEQPAVVHAIPEPGSNGISACCNRPPCEFVGERVTRDPNEVTCPGPAVVSQPDGEA